MRENTFQAGDRYLRIIWKKFIRKFVRDEHGAVSVYLILVTLLLFFFNAVLIDYARILVAQRQTEDAAKTALKSTMASFDQGVHSYELFGLDSEKQSELDNTFKEAFQKNLSGGTGNYYNFADSSAENVSIKASRPLSDESVLDYQILEDMKYRAPIEFTKEIINGFLGVSDAMQEASTYVDVVNQIDPYVTNRDKYLDKIKKDLLEAQKKLSSINPKIVGSSISTFPSVNNLADIVKFFQIYKDIMSKINSIGNLDEQDKKDKADAIQFENNVKHLLDSLINPIKDAKLNLNDANLQLGFVKDNNDTIRSIIDAERKKKKANYKDTNPYSNGATSDATNSLEDANHHLDDFVIDDQLINTLDDQITKALNSLDQSKSGSMLDQLNQLKGFENMSLGTINSLVNQTKSSYQEAQDAIQQALDTFAKIEKVYKDKDTEKKKNEAQKELEKSKQTLDQLLKDAKNVVSDAEVYPKLAELVTKYKGANNSSKDRLKMNDPDQVAKDAMGFMDSLFSKLGDAITGTRDRLYINEYILTHFAHHDFSLKGTDAYTFENNEVEYLIYGIPAGGANYTAALAELFVVRFAVNFVDAFTQANVRAFGPYMWAAALVFALGKTNKDMLDLTSSNPALNNILFFGDINFRTDYKDYLRLFLFMNPDGLRKQRIMAVIDNNSGSDLTKRSTYITAEATSSIKLWFLPEIASMLNKTGIFDGAIEGKKYKIKVKAAYSY